MDIQMKRGLLDLCALAAISKHDSYGYQIIKDLEEYVSISESTLYPILRRLESSGQLSSYSVEYNGRLRKYYKITPLGHERLKEFVDEWKQIVNIYKFITEGRDE